MGFDSAIRRAIAAVDQNQPVFITASMRAFISDSIADRRFIMILLAITAILALLMSAAGVYGVVSYATSRRTQEIGLRMALGASRDNVQGLIFRQGFAAVFAGLLIGIGLVIVLLRVLRGIVAGLEAYSTRMAAPRLPSLQAAEVVVLPNGESARPLLMPGKVKPAGEKKRP